MLAATVLGVSAVIAAEFVGTGLSIMAVLAEYSGAAKAHLHYSAGDILRQVGAWPLLFSAVLLAMLAAHRSAKGLTSPKKACAVLATYFAVQLALNMTNNWHPNMWLAPAAAFCLLFNGVKPDNEALPISEIASWTAYLSKSVRAIPIVLAIIVLAPEMMSSAAALMTLTRIGLYLDQPVVVSAGKGVSLSALAPRGSDDYATAISDAIAALSSRGVDRATIANLDFSNPFPALFLAPSPRGVQVWWDWGNSVPKDALLKWEDVIGDACVVTLPLRPAVAAVTAKLEQAVSGRLSSDFNLLFHDDLWMIYEQKGGCGLGQLLKPS